MGQPIYREVQQFFRQWIFLLPVTAVTVIVWYEFAQQVVLGHPQGDQPIPNGLAWGLTIVFGLGFPVLAVLIRLVTEVRQGELMVRLFPFRRALIPVEMISQAVVRQYSPIKEYGGWGVRLSRHNGRAYNAYGTEGVQLMLMNGALILVGSQKPQELVSALRMAGFEPREAEAPARPGRAREQETE